MTTDPLRTFVDALPPVARRRFTLDPTTIPLLHAAADQGHDLPALARTVGHDTGRYSNEDARRLMVFRIRRALGHDNDQEGEA